MKKRMSKERIRATAIKSTRALIPAYQGMLPTIEMTIDSDERERFTIEMDHDTARNLIEQLTSAYEATAKPLKPRGRSFN